MKIAYLIPNCGVSGGIAVVCQHANRLLNKGHQVYLVTETREKSINWFPNQRVPIITLPDIPSDLDILVGTSWSTSFKLVNLEARHKFYFVQSDETRFYENDSIWQNLAALSYHLDFNYFTEARWIKKWLKENFNHNPTLIPNGLDGDIFFPDKPLSPKTKKPRILLEGAIDLPYKGMEDAFKVVNDLDAEVWCISYSGQPKPDWHCDQFFSQVPMEKMRRIYSSCDILLKLSRVEGFFGPPLEMMACGGAVVVGKVTGYDEYIVDNFNALVVEPGDEKAAKEAITEIISNPNLREMLIRNGLETAKTWEWKSSIEKLERYFYEMVSGKKEANCSSTRLKANQAIAFAYHSAINKETINSNSSTSIKNYPNKYINKTNTKYQTNPKQNYLSHIIKRIINILKDIYFFIIISHSGLFDPNYYIIENPDVRKADIHPVWHYLKIGWKEGRNPSSSFITEYYLEKYKDVQKAGINPLVHYIRKGKNECRSTTKKRVGEHILNNQAKIFNQKIENAKTNDYKENKLSGTIGRATNSKLNWMKDKKLAIVSQPEYFRFSYENELDYFSSFREFKFTYSMTNDGFSELLNYNADYNIFFRGEHIPSEVLQGLSGIKINLSSEPFPRLINGQIEYSKDSLKRYQEFQLIKEKPYDYVYHYDANSLDYMQNDGLHLSGEFVFPVALNTYKPIEVGKKWDLFFIGRSTNHREAYFSPLKHNYNFLHIAHGIWGEELVKYICSSEICLNIHAEDEISWEPRIQMLLACGAFVISEPISPNNYLRPGIDYIEVTNNNEIIDLIHYYINNKNEMRIIAKNGLNRVREFFNCRQVYFNLLYGIEQNHFQKFESNST